MTTCNSTLSNGEPCNAPALNNGACCRHHDPNRPHPQAQSRLRECQPLQLPPLHDKPGVFSAIVEVVHAISERRIKRSEGGTLLFGLQLASSLISELDQMALPHLDGQYDGSSARRSAQEMVNSPEQIERLEQRRRSLKAAGNNSYVPTQQDMNGFMANFECANARKLAKIIAAKRE